MLVVHNESHGLFIDIDSSLLNLREKKYEYIQ